MGTSLLRSHDYLQCHDALCLTPPSIRSHTNPNPSPNPNPCLLRRRRLYDGDYSGMVVKGPGPNLVMGQVKILKRGEKLSPDDDANIDSGDEGFDLVLGSTNRLGPDPSSVPVPAFLAMRSIAVGFQEQMKKKLKAKGQRKREAIRD